MSSKEQKPPSDPKHPSASGENSKPEPTKPGPEEPVFKDYASI